MPDIKRRNIVKGISIMGAATLSPISLQAAKHTDHANPSIAMYINTEHGKFKHSLANEIINTARHSIMINTKQPVGYKQSNGRNFAVYANAPKDGYTLQPGERLATFARVTKTKPANTMLIAKSG